MRIAICDDDTNFANTLKILIAKGTYPPNDIPDIFVCSDGSSLFSDIPDYDAVFLDIDIPVFNGFQIAEQLNRLGETLIIFVTMHDELVYSSIKFQPFRFIRKSRLESELPEVLSALIKQLPNEKPERNLSFRQKQATFSLI